MFFAGLAGGFVFGLLVGFGLGHLYIRSEDKIHYNKDTGDFHYKP